MPGKIAAMWNNGTVGGCAPRGRSIGWHGFAVGTAIVLGLGVAGCGPGAGDRAKSTSAGAKSEITVGVTLLNLSSEFIVMLNQAMEKQAAALGVRLKVTDAQRSAERQVQQVESFVAQQVDVIILNPCEVEASSPAVDRARAAGIPIVNVNSETRSAPDAFVGSRDEESAQLAMEYIAQRLEGRGSVVMMHGYLGQAAQIKRDQGAREVLKKYPGLTLLADQTAEWDRAKAVSLMENWIQAHGSKLQAVFAQNDEMALGALVALEQAQMKDRVIVVGVDGIADALAAVKAGRLDATVLQDAQGQGSTAVEMAVKLARGETCPKETHLPFKLVTREGVPGR